jgi:hypothetical protein
LRNTVRPRGKGGGTAPLVTTVPRWSASPCCTSQERQIAGYALMQGIELTAAHEAPGSVTRLSDIRCQRRNENVVLPARAPHLCEIAPGLAERYGVLIAMRGEASMDHIPSNRGTAGIVRFLRGAFAAGAMLLAWWYDAHAAPGDYDGKWLYKGTCSSMLIYPWAPSAGWENVLTIENGKYTGSGKRSINGEMVSSQSVLNIQDGALSIVSELQGDHRYHMDLTGRAVSPTEIDDNGPFLIFRNGQWVQSRTCTGKFVLLEPGPNSVARRSGTVAVATVPRPPQQAPIPAHGRVALVIGNGGYLNVAALRNPVNDSRAVAAALRRMGFEVMEGRDMTAAAMRQIVQDYVRRAGSAEVALLFYSGHGVQIDGRNYLIPVDAKLVEARSLASQATGVDDIIDGISTSAGADIVLLDACRDNPFAQKAGVENVSGRQVGGLAARSAITTRSVVTDGASVRGFEILPQNLAGTAGTLIAFATAPGRTALDGSGQNSPFTTGLLRYLETPRLEIRQLLTKVRVDVLRDTGNQQVPWENSSLVGDLYLAR